MGRLGGLHDQNPAGTKNLREADSQKVQILKLLHKIYNKHVEYV